MAKHARLKTRSAVRKSPAVADSARSGTRRAVTGNDARVLAEPLPAPESVALFEQAVEAFHRKQYGVAGERFRAVITRFPAERALLDRTRVYLQLVDREMNNRPAGPRTIEERLTAATAALNNEQDAEAERLVRSVLADQAKHELALYLMAAIEARRGDADAALSLLGKAIAVSPEVRAQARYDRDFDRLRSLEAFHTLVDPAGRASGARKPPMKHGFR